MEKLHPIIEDSYFFRILSRMRENEALRSELIRVGDALGIKRPQHLTDDSAAKLSSFEEKIEECRQSMQLVLEGKMPRHDG
jgi:hypothetical protein